ncbi:hypothetical protein AB833_08760 [Chromatiales bacterium (ex Bugula neritina AB1)]|nr:hypothetical protein AB833_08760 [Chromatiales bacterium (ex Bugula neritina AB1)]
MEIADKEFKIKGRKQSSSRISLLTGISRREVKKILDDPQSKVANSSDHNRAVRVFSGWLRDSEFHNESGEPKALSISKTGPGTFTSLVKRYSGDIPVRAVLDELLRVKAIDKITNDLVSMSSTGYVPQRSRELLDNSSHAVADLITTIDHNDKCTDQENTRLQLTVSYDNLTPHSTRLFKILSRDKSKELLLSLDRFLAEHDLDTTTSGRSGPNFTSRIRTGLSIFYFEESLSDNNDLEVHDEDVI